MRPGGQHPRKCHAEKSSLRHQIRVLAVVLLAIACAAFATACGDGPAETSTEEVSEAQAAVSGDTAGEEASNVEPPTVSSELPAFPSPEAVEEALQTWLGEGSVTVAEEHGDATAAQRTYQLPPGSLGDAVLAGEDGPSIQVMAFAYSADRIRHSGIYDVDRDYGGDTPEEVYASSVIMIRDVGAAANWGESVGEHPDIACGLVTDVWNDMVLAGDGDYWYEAHICGLKGSPAFDEVLVELAKLLAQLD